MPAAAGASRGRAHGMGGWRSCQQPPLRLPFRGTIQRTSEQKRSQALPRVRFLLTSKGLKGRWGQLVVSLLSAVILLWVLTATVGGNGVERAVLDEARLGGLKREPIPPTRVPSLGLHSFEPTRPPSKEPWYFVGNVKAVAPLFLRVDDAWGNSSFAGAQSHYYLWLLGFNLRVATRQRWWFEGGGDVGNDHWHGTVTP
jgi:hypothetical protein